MFLSAPTLDHETMLGLKKTQAGHDVVAQKRKPKKVKKEEAEEWHGFSGSVDGEDDS